MSDVSDLQERLTRLEAHVIRIYTLLGVQAIFLIMVIVSVLLLALGVVGD
jgi:hypothetical protein